MLPPSDDTPQHSSAVYALGVCAFLFVVIWLIYVQTLDHELLSYDDNGFVSDNPQVTAGLTQEGIRWAFTKGPYGEWYPLSTMSHMLDCQLYGLKPWGHHLTNVLLHCAVSIALFLVLWRMTSELWPSTFVATVFAVHPQHVESVAWVAERRDVLSGLFFMLTLAAYQGYVRHGRSVFRYGLVAALFALGLMSKPMLVTLPPLLLLLDYWPLGRMGSAIDTPDWAHSAERPGAWWLVLEKLPLVGLAVGDCFMTLRTHYAVGAPLAWSGRIGNAAVSCVTYVEQFFYPVDLAAIYPLPPGGPPGWKAFGAIVILASISAAAVICRRKCPYLFVGWFWFLGMLVPVLGLVQVADHAMADRYMYLPSIGLYIASGWGAARLAAHFPKLRGALVVTAGLAIGALVVCAAWQTSFWRDDETLWTHTLANTTDNDAAEIGLGFTLARQGRYDEASALYREALALKPDSFHAHAHLGVALTRLGRFDEAAEHLHRAIEINPSGTKAYLGLGQLLAIQGKFDEACAALKQALMLEPHNSAVHNDMGSVLFLQGNIDESILEYEATVEIDPNFVLGHINLADALAANNQIAQAVAHYTRALQLDPHNQLARQKLDAILQPARPLGS